MALFTVDEAAAYLNVTPRFVRRLIAERRIGFVKLGRHVRLEERALDEFVAAGRCEAPRRLRMVPGRPAG
jgi:excisionase family DNA binding protein